MLKGMKRQRMSDRYRDKRSLTVEHSVESVQRVELRLVSFRVSRRRVDDWARTVSEVGAHVHRHSSYFVAFRAFALETRYVRGVESHTILHRADRLD